jgi:DNA-binding transcriptional LysR family regulator
MMELRQLRYFEAVARHGSFTNAAMELFVVQSALSQQIKRLESEVKVELLNRRGRTVTVTEAGEVFLEQTLEILNRLDDLTATMRTYSEQDTDQVSVGALHTLMASDLDFASACATFAAQSEVGRLRFVEGHSGVLAQQVRNEELDVAVLDVALLQSVSGLDVLPIEDGHLCLHVARDHPLAKEPSCRFEDLASETFVRLGVGSGTRAAAFVRAARRFGFEPRFVVDAGGVSTARTFVAEGRAVQVTQPWVEHAHRDSIVMVPIRNPPPELLYKIALVTLHGRGFSPPVARLIARIRHYLTTHHHTSPTVSLPS